MAEANVKPVPGHSLRRSNAPVGPPPGALQPQRRGRRQGQGKAGAGGATGPAATFVPLFLIALLIPINIHLGDLRLSFYRVVLLVTFLPVALNFLLRRGPRLRWADIMMICYSITGSASLLVTGASIASAGVFVLESFGSYGLARMYVRSVEDFTAMVRVFFWCVVATIPFALYENLTGDPLVLSTLGAYLPVLPDVPHEIRLGLDRAQVVFDHPILYGVFCALAFAPVLYVAGLRQVPRLHLFRAALVGVGAFASLSSGAFVAVALQCLLVAWDLVVRFVRQRWKLLIGLVAAMGVVLEVFSNRTLPQIAIEFLALNQGTAWTRLLVNGYALENIAQKPFFGIGLHGDWQRPDWLTNSIDNFWLATTLRYGVPAGVLLLAGVLAAFWTIARAPNEDPRVEACRKGLLISLVSVSTAIITVHLWNSTYCLFLLLVGSGMWIADRPATEPQAPREASSGWRHRPGLLSRRSPRGGERTTLGGSAGARKGATGGRSLAGPDRRP